MKIARRFEIQESQYKEPYHHYVSFSNRNFKLYKTLSWGLDYYSYIIQIIKEVIIFNPQNVADVGCGDGKVLIELSNIFKHSILEGYDLSKKAISFAKAYGFGINNIRFFDTDFSFSKKKYDLIICSEVLEHIPDNQIKNFIIMLHSHLKSKGKLILTVPSTNMSNIGKHYRHYSIELLNKTIQDGKFRNEKIIYVSKISFLYRILQFILINPIFILNNNFLQNIIFKIFKFKCVFAERNNSRRIVAIYSKI